MELRPELLPPPVSRQRIAELSQEIERIAELPGDAAEAAIAAFNESTGHGYDWSSFACYAGGRDLEDFAKEAARPAYPRVPDITRDELIEIVRRIQAVDPEQDYYLLLLRTNVTHPGVHSLIYHPPPELLDASAERIVDAALSYRPIAL